MPSNILADPIKLGSLNVRDNYGQIKNTPKLNSSDIPGLFLELLYFPASTTATSGSAAQNLGVFTQSISTGITLYGAAAQNVSALTQSVSTGQSISTTIAQTVDAFVQAISPWQSISGAVSTIISAFTQAVTVVLSGIPAPHFLAPLIRRLEHRLDNRTDVHVLQSRQQVEVQELRSVDQ